jgi:hypothetical protein
MPAWLQEGNIAAPTDSELRSAAKLCQIYYDLNGPQPSPFPEGVAPFPGDDLQRLYQKIRILQGLDSGGGGGEGEGN